MVQLYYEDFAQSANMPLEPKLISMLFLMLLSTIIWSEFCYTN